MSKKTFYIILSILAGLVIVGGLIWYFFFKPSTPAPTDSAGFTLPGQEITAGLEPISEGPAVSAHFVGDILLFYDFSGQLWQLNSGELKPSLSAQQTAENPKPGTKSIAFSPDGKKIAYYISDLKNNSLFISDADGKNQKTLFQNFPLRDIILSWPKTNQIAITSKPSGLVAGGLWTFDIITLKLTKILDNLPGLEVIFSSSGDNFIYSFVDPNGQNPILMAFKKGVSKNQNISTMVDKCAWAGDSINIYCAVPKSWPDSVVLPDDYYKSAISTIDDIWKINAETGAKNVIFENVGDASNLAASGGEDNLIFILKNSGFLYKLKLTP
ncbi:MAG: hypothetical protein Q7S78_02010 [Candidatus Azambacteria bacterium]|nr:hypothetical protein [Candidatus Azambacteria bacterium]